MRRGLICAMSVALLPVPHVSAQERWYRGNLHMHTLWSDGRAFPEDAAAWYRDHGYQFISITDHNLLQTDTNAWREIGGKGLPGREMADRYLESYPAEAELKKEGGKEFLRLKTVWELKARFDRPGEFLLVPGQEPSQAATHMNAINVRENIPYRYGATIAETFRRNENALRAWGQEHNVPTLFMLNHPTWPYFNILPEVLIGLPQIRFFELCNADAGNWYPAHPSWYSIEKFWDIVNAFRIEDGHDPVFGTATDDTHHYGDPQAPMRPGEGWVCVRAARLDPDALVHAMYRGDFYASTGVSLEDVSFDEAAGTLRVRVKPDADTTYGVRFTTTRAGFDRAVETFDDPAAGKKPGLTGVRYSDAIGQTVTNVAGIEASYTMTPDDLYVRATVVSSRQAINRVRNEPEYDTAWTQPYGWRLWQARNPKQSRMRP